MLRNNGKQKYLVFDFETENLRLTNKNRPWQISWALCQCGKVLETQNFYIWWADLNVSAGAAQATRFNYGEYKEKAVPQKSVFDKLKKLLADKKLKYVFHNGFSFDIYIWNNWRAENGLKADFSYLPRCIDTLCLSKALFMNEMPQKDDILQWQLKFTSERLKKQKTNLGAMAEYLDIELDKEKLHDAAYDVEINYMVFNKLIYRMEI